MKTLKKRLQRLEKTSKRSVAQSHRFLDGMLIGLYPLFAGCPAAVAHLDEILHVRFSSEYQFTDFRTLLFRASVLHEFHTPPPQPTVAQTTGVFERIKQTKDRNACCSKSAYV